MTRKVRSRIDRLAKKMEPKSEWAWVIRWEDLDKPDAKPEWKRVSSENVVRWEDLDDPDIDNGH